MRLNFVVSELSYFIAKMELCYSVILAGRGTSRRFRGLSCP